MQVVIEVKKFDIFAYLTTHETAVCFVQLIIFVKISVKHYKAYIAKFN